MLKPRDSMYVTTSHHNSLFDPAKTMRKTKRRKSKGNNKGIPKAGKRSTSISKQKQSMQTSKTKADSRSRPVKTLARDKLLSRTVQMAANRLMNNLGNKCESFQTRGRSAPKNKSQEAQKKSKNASLNRLIA